MNVFTLLAEFLIAEDLLKNSSTLTVSAKEELKKVYNKLGEDIDAELHEIASSAESSEETK